MSLARPPSYKNVSIEVSGMKTPLAFAKTERVGSECESNLPQIGWISPRMPPPSTERILKLSVGCGWTVAAIVGS